MIALDSRALRRSLTTAGCALLLVVAVSALAAGVQPGHLHTGDVPGLFNDECPLAALAAFHGVSSLAGSPLWTWVALVAGLAAAGRSERPPASPLRLTGSRAPPLLLG
ncbi:MAG TPA: hypothetical protein VEL75_20330 [Candidatus Methylomirabilis sp.]|nr:hypothetical protein [Candidatus Methylomirabilis sp.]